MHQEEKWQAKDHTENIYGLEKEDGMIELNQLSKKFERPGGGTFSVLHQVDLKLEPGETVGIAGTSGSGKTTLINIAAGLLAPDKGSVLINGVNLYDMNEAKRDCFRAKNIGYIFQNFNLIASLNAYENVMVALYFGKRVPRKAREKRCRELLEKVGLEHRLKHRPDQLSGGEQQRVCIARALANCPPLLLADEPTANLDAGNRRQIRELLLDMCRMEKITLLAAAHDEELLNSMSRVIYLEEGRREVHVD